MHDPLSAITEGERDKSVSDDKDLSVLRNPVAVPSVPWTKLAVDVIGPLDRLGVQKRFLFLLIDYTSLWIKHKFVSSTTTSTLIEFLRDSFTSEGVPETIVIDKGVKFSSIEIKEFMNELGIKREETNLHGPKANGLVDMTVHMVKKHIQLALVNGLDVDKTLREGIWAYHTSPNSVTRISPFASIRERSEV